MASKFCKTIGRIHRAEVNEKYRDLKSLYSRSLPETRVHGVSMEVVRIVRPKEVEENITRAKRKQFIAEALAKLNSKKKETYRDDRFIKCKSCNVHFKLKKKRSRPWRIAGFCSAACRSKVNGRSVAKPKSPLKKPKPRTIRVVKVDKDFYISRAWRELRYDVLTTYGRKCRVCFRSEIELHVDHIKPISKHPELALDFNNLQVLCVDCNKGKSNRDAIDWR